MQRLYDSQIQVEDIYNRIKFYRNGLIKSYCPYDRRFYENLILNEIENLIMIRDQFMQNSREMEKEFTIDELAKYDGKNGNPAYVAVDGTVYDVSVLPSWGGGTHFGLYSGKDLTTQFKSCHNMMDILNKVPKVGVMKP
ncbi:MAG: steroid-binding protein [Clostridiaceae bacterium]|nr:steroid-binding protein [Clostridiaceae bacterium]